MKEHPDKVPYLLNHSSKESWLETTLKNALLEKGIKDFIQEYQNSRYSYDFAWQKIKLDIECDGQTHFQEKVKKIDLERDKFSKLQGWTVLRFNWNDIRYNLIEVVNKIEKIIKELVARPGIEPGFQN